MTRKEKILDIAMLLGTAFAILTALYADFAGHCDEMYNSTFRLHISAASDSETDQRIKYELRDYILTDIGEIFTECDSAADAERAAVLNTELIARKANDRLAEMGCEYSAAVSVGTEKFPTRVYSDYTLPGGYYHTLRLTLGEGKGRNWWCVLYPTVCIGAAGTQKSVLPQRTLYERNKVLNRMTSDSLKAERGSIEFRFAIYDFLKSLAFDHA